MAKFQYDENGGTFFYFLLSFQALVIIPCTYYFFPRAARKEEKRDNNTCHCEQCCIKNNRLRSKEPWRKAKERFIKLLLLLGWTCLFLTAYKVAHLQHDYVVYDPFQILEIESDSSMAEIKKAYRRLSLIFHPDKDTGNEKKFMMIAKAYAALTDNEARKNYELYGNPDGPGATSFGIALPSWIIEKENSIWVLGLYALVFMVALPIGVGVWWYNSVKFGTEKVLLDTSQLYYYFIYKTPFMVFKRILMIVGASLEFERGHNNEVIERPSDNIEVPQLIKELAHLGEKNRENPLCHSYSIKARALIHAHLSRMKLSKTLEEDKLYVVKKCPILIQEFVACTAQLTMLALAGRISRMPSLETMERAMKLSSCIVQALWDNKSSLLQLPHINEDMLKHFTTRRRNIRSIRNLACMQEDVRRAMLRQLNDDQYYDVMCVIAKLPVLEVHVKTEVLDDEDSCIITTGAIVTVTATLIRKNMSSLFEKEECLQEEKDDDEKDKKGDEYEQLPIPNGDVSPKGKKTKVWEKPKKKKGKPGRGGAKKEKKHQVASHTVKNAHQNKKSTVNGNLQNGVIHAQNEKTEEKPKKESSSYTSNYSHDSDSDSSHSDSVSEENDSRGKNDDEDNDWKEFQEKVTKKEKILEKSKKSHSVHCPYFPDDKQEHWWVYVADKRKRNALITNPYFVTNLVDKEEVELKFAAPLKPGVYVYSLVVRSDSYIDFDVIKTIELDVKEAKEVDITKIQWDVSEEEEEKDEEESAVEDSDLATDDEVEEI